MTPFVLLALCAAVHAERAGDEPVAGSSPVRRVLDLLTKLRDEVKGEGETEATTYDNFACFCKTTTNEKTDLISEKDGLKTNLEASLKQLNGEKGQLSSDIKTTQNAQAAKEKSLARATEIRNSELGTYTEDHTDTSNAVSGVADAITVITGSKDTLVQTKSKVVRDVLTLAQTAGLTTSQHDRVSALLQEIPIPEVPDNNYDFHSNGIVDLLTGLKTQWTEKKTTLETEEQASADAFSTAADSMRDQIQDDKNSIDTYQSQLATCESNIARDTGDLTEATALLNDARTYLKDLNGQCESKAREWDQRSQLRKNELTALASALEILQVGVQANEARSGAGGRPAPAAPATSDLLQTTSGSDADTADVSDTYSDVVFVKLNEVEVRAHAASHTAELRTKGISILKKDAAALKSPVLNLLAMQVAADPFAKVKTLIQGLIERLLSEATDEATHKGWCDTELAHARTDRSYRDQDAHELAASTEVLEARKADLHHTAGELTTDITNLNTALNDATVLRDSEHTENNAVLAAAEDGLAALKNAIKVLEDFYRKSSRADVSLVQGSPVDADRAGAGGSHDGAYQGGQAQAGGILGMLATIQSDFERTIKKTTASEYDASRTFTAFRIETNSSIHSQTRALQHTNAEFSMTSSDLVSDLNDMRDNQELLDASLRQLEVLRPACIDTAMTWEQKVEKRNAEIDALKNALCTLDEEDNEYSDKCPQNSFLQKRK